MAWLVSKCRFLGLLLPGRRAATCTHVHGHGIGLRLCERTFVLFAVPYLGHATARLSNTHASSKRFFDQRGGNTWFTLNRFKLVGN